MTDIGKRARDLGEEAIQTLHNEMLAADESKDRIRAAVEILDRGYGKPSQAIIAIPAARARDKRLAASAYTDEELDQIIDAEIVARRELEDMRAPALLEHDTDPLLK